VNVTLPCDGIGIFGTEVVKGAGPGSVTFICSIDYLLDDKDDEQEDHVDEGHRAHFEVRED
jgi:hypothetical protein